MQRDEAAGATQPQPNKLEDFGRYAHAAAHLAELRRQDDDLSARLIEATRRRIEACRDKPIPPPGHDAEVNELNQRIRTLKAEIVAAEHALRSAASEASIAISKAAKPAHDALRARVLAALRELRDALLQEQIFRAAMDARGVLAGSVIKPATISFLTEPGKLEAIINNLTEA